MARAEGSVFQAHILSARAAAPVPAEPRVEQRGGGRAGGEEGRAEVVLPVFVGGLLELAPRCPRSGDAGAAINHPPAPPPRPLPPPTQPSADAKIRCSDPLHTG